MTIHKQRAEIDVWTALTQGDLPALDTTIRRLFAAVPWENCRGNPISL